VSVEETFHALVGELDYPMFVVTAVNDCPNRFVGRVEARLPAGDHIAHLLAPIAAERGADHDDLTFTGPSASSLATSPEAGLRKACAHARRFRLPLRVNHDGSDATIRVPMQPAERDILAEIQNELRLSREQRERSESRYAQVISDSDARHAALQREVLESNRMVMRRMDGLVRRAEEVFTRNTETLAEAKESIENLGALAEAQTEGLLRIFERLPPPGESTA